jgi:adenine deaminase
LQVDDDSEQTALADIVVLDSPAERRLENVLLTGETVGETSRVSTTPMKAMEASSNPTNDPIMESLHGDHVKFTISDPSFKHTGSSFQDPEKLGHNHTRLTRTKENYDAN